MKLPGIEYSTQVQSLGRENVSAPLAVANAQASALTKIGNVATVIEANDVAVAAARFKTEMANLNAAAKGRKSYTTDELDGIGVKYGEKYGADKIPNVPAYLVSNKVYQKLSNELYNTHTSGVSRKGKAVMAKMYGQMYKEGVSAVVANSMKEAYSLRVTAIESDFDDVVAGGDAEAARMIADTALATGMWSAEKHYSKTKGMPNKIAGNQYLNSLANIEDPNVLEIFVNNALSDPRLEPASKNRIYKSFEAKIKALNKANDKADKETKDQESYDSFVLLSTDTLDSGTPMDWGDVQREALNMRPTDGKGLITLNKLMRNKGVTTDPKVHMALTTRVKTLSLPVEGTTIHQRRKSITDELLRATGVDPLTGEQIGPSKISPQDFATLWSDINKAQAFAYDNPEVKRVSDFIWTTLTGGSKDMMTRLFGSGPDTINATKAEAAMLTAARAGGPAFDPDQWWQQNGLKYITASVEDNEKSLKESQLDKFVVRDFNDAGGINLDKTSKAIYDRVKSKQMSKEDADRAMKDIYKLRQQRIQKMEMFNNTKGNK